MIPPLAKRLKAELARLIVVETAGNRAVYVSKPDFVAALIEQAAAAE